MRLAFVIQRYGLEVHGGSEYHCRAWAERLARRHHVEVLTTCARDYLTWADFYKPGTEELNNVRVQRFRVDAPRDMNVFNAFSLTIFGQPHTEDQEIEWMRLGGPYSSALFDAIEQQQDDFDLFIFMTYLYCTTFFGMPRVRHKAAFVPTAHDEPPIYLGIFQRVFHLPRYIMYNTPTERAMLLQLFNIHHIPGSEVGVGVDMPPASYSDHETDPQQPRVLYIGRIHPSKGCDQLYDYMLRYRQERRLPLRLIMVGRADMDLPEHPDVLYAGFVSEDMKHTYLQECSIVVVPSPFESLSIVLLEAWAMGKPVLANGRTPVLREQVLRSGGGLFYESYEEFAACLDMLLTNKQLRRQLGQQGRRFVEQYYTWAAVEQRLEEAIENALLTIAESPYPNQIT
jgi:glycosyltransferase involved in cell wall biosynthesis